MSCIQPSEIIDLTVAAFKVRREDLRLRAPTHSDPFSEPQYAARICSAMLIKRHTKCSAVGLATALGVRNWAWAQWENQMDRLQVYAVRHLAVARTIEEIERQIDLIHEARIDAQVKRLVEPAPITCYERGSFAFLETDESRPR